MQIKLLLFTLALSLPLSLVGVARADHTVQEFQEARAAGGAKWQALQLYVEGLGDGIEQASRRPLSNGGMIIIDKGNVTLENGRQRPQSAYCPNAKQPLNLDTYLYAIDKEIGISEPTGNQWLGQVLMSGLTKVFPCEGKRPG